MALVTSFVQVASIMAESSKYSETYERLTLLELMWLLIYFLDSAAFSNIT